MPCIARILIFITNIVNYFYFSNLRFIVGETKGSFAYIGQQAGLVSENDKRGRCCECCEEGSGVDS
jgi:hypothetical protein